ncbi:MAG TPA: diguanylate cyclase [Geobacteraceae bacterium]
MKVAFLHDTTERKRTENELEAKLRRLEVEKALYEGIVDAIGDGITIQDTEYRIFYQNRPHRELMGDHVGAYCYQAYGGRESVCDDCPLRVVLEEEISHTVERHVGKGDDTQFFEITVSPLRDSTGKVVAGIEVIREITERKRAEERLRYMSSHDVLTGLYNRSFFEEELERLQRGRHFPLSVIMADVDDLKVVNDSKGHSAGDELLVRAAILFKEAFRGEDIVARIGGDEFAVLLPSTDAETADVALMRVREALDSWNRNYPIPINLSLGRGTAMEGDEILSALKAADQSMYQYKLERTGRAPRREPNGTGSR